MHRSQYRAFEVLNTQCYFLRVYKAGVLITFWVFFPPPPPGRQWTIGWHLLPTWHPVPKDRHPHFISSVLRPPGPASSVILTQARVVLGGSCNHLCRGRGTLEQGSVRMAGPAAREPRIGEIKAINLNIPQLPILLGLGKTLVSTLSTDLCSRSPSPICVVCSCPPSLAYDSRQCRVWCHDTW